MRIIEEMTKGVGPNYDVMEGMREYSEMVISKMASMGYKVGGKPIKAKSE